MKKFLGACIAACLVLAGLASCSDDEGCDYSTPTATAVSDLNQKVYDIADVVESEGSTRLKESAKEEMGASRLPAGIYYDAAKKQYLTSSGSTEKAVTRFVMLTWKFKSADSGTYIVTRKADKGEEEVVGNNGKLDSFTTMHWFDTDVSSETYTYKVYTRGDSASNSNSKSISVTVK